MSRVADWLRRHLDVGLLLVAILFALPTLGYAYGRDQASFHYVAREWLDGAVPYRDTLDQKPPFIYVVHVLAILLSGGAQWGIRLLDLAALLGMAVLLTRAVPGRAPRGTTGVVAILLVGFHATAFDYWMSAQVEIWEGLLLLGAWIAALRIERPDRRAALSGLLSALAILCKLPAVIVAVVIAARLGWRAFQERRWRGLLRALLLHGAGGAAAFGLVILYWGAHGALREMWDVVVEFNRAYAENARDWPTSWIWIKDWFQRGVYYPIFVASWIGGLVLAARDRGALRDLAWAAALLVAALATVVVQRKFFAYHWCVTLPFTVLGATVAVHRAATRWPLGSAAAALVVLTVGFLGAPGWNMDKALSYRSYTHSFLHYKLGERPRQEFLRHFNQRGHQYGDMEIVSAKLRELAGADDILCVEGYEPAFYVMSGLRCSHRFYATHFMNDPRERFPLLPRWRAERAQALAARPPTFEVGRNPEALRRKDCRPVFHHGIWWLGDCRR